MLGSQVNKGWSNYQLVFYQNVNKIKDLAVKITTAEFKISKTISPKAKER